MNGLQSKITAGKFVVTMEVAPPKGTDVSTILKQATTLQGFVDAVNITDNQRATMHASPLSIAYLLKQVGLDPICQFACRDRNALALQSELLSAAILGIKNILILTGDLPQAGDHPYAKAVFDLNSVQLLEVAVKLQQGQDLSGNILKGKPEFFLGAVADPSLAQADLTRLQQKITAGAQFIQTQIVYDADLLNDFIDQFPQVAIIAGIFPLLSLKTAKFINDQVPGVVVPESVFRRLSMAKDERAEGIKIAIEIISKIKNKAAGIHIMSMNHLEVVKTILENI